MEVPTLELRPQKGENSSLTNDDRSSSPTNPTPLPPYSDMDHDFVTSQFNDSPNNGNVIEIDGNSEEEPMDGDTQDTNERTNKNERTCAFSVFYAEVMIFVAAIFVFLEVIPGPVPLLFFQVYVFLYLLCVSIIIFVITYAVKRICPQSVYSEYNTNHKEALFERNVLYSNISIYLRIAVFVFGLVTFITDVLEIASFYNASSNCKGVLNYIEIILREIFNLLQIHFLVVGAKEIIHFPRILQYIALMHLLATNFSIWMRLLIWEGAKDWLDATHIKHNSSTVWPPKIFSVSYHSVESDVKSTDIAKHYPTHNVYLTTNCYWRDPEEVANTEDIISHQLCLQNSTVGAIWGKAMPYLYAFKIEYSLIAVVIIFFIWSNLQTFHLKTKQLTDALINTNNKKNQKINCSNSAKDLFLGSIVMVAGIISIIVFYVQLENEAVDKVILTTAFRIGIFFVTTVAAVLGFRQIKNMKSQKKQHYYMIEVLQEVEKLAVYCFGICSMVAGGIVAWLLPFAKTQHIVLFFDGMLTIVQAFQQSLFIQQVSKKKLSPSNMNVKAVMRVVILLIFSNLCLWLFESIIPQNQQGTLLQRQLFGDIVWPLISRIIMPLVIFYRLHSTVLLVEAWRKLQRIHQN